mmetsp:Transcript_51659/g.155057  ORF Transcript_51659/g.155057 Transcript_51659/m.155057 type:complete len:521 (-) Transcript_51659:565-2127(-)
MHHVRLYCVFLACSSFATTASGLCFGHRRLAGQGIFSFSHPSSIFRGRPRRRLREVSLPLGCDTREIIDSFADASNKCSESKDGKGGSSFFKPQVGPFSFKGKHKWLGGAVDDKGCIYGIPSHSSEVICLAPDEDGVEYQVRTIPLPTAVAKGKFKWLRGIICKGYLYGIPAWAAAGVLRVDIDGLWGRRDVKEKEIVTILPLPADLQAGNTDFGGDDAPSRWLWHGAALNANKTAIYCIPSNAMSVLKIDLDKNTTSSLPIPLDLPSLKCTNKWYGGLLGDDGCIYGVPYAAAGVLQVNTNTDTVAVLGDYGLQKYNWHGGVKRGPNIFCFPAHSPNILKIDTTRSATECKGQSKLSEIKIQRAPYDKDTVTRYKWLGGCVGSDRAIYGVPSDASSILRIDETDQATTFGSVSGEKNKYQGGVLGRDGYVYAVPSNAKHVLRIDTRPESWIEDKNDRSKATIIGDLPPLKDKWQGGFTGKDGSIFAIPENFDKILELTPPTPRGGKGDCEDDRVSVCYL